MVTSMWGMSTVSAILSSLAIGNELPSGGCPVGEMNSGIEFIISGTRAE
jgi:hypothetical protein